MKSRQKKENLGKKGGDPKRSTNLARWRGCVATGITASSFSDCSKFGTWNVRSLNEPGKLANVLQEMNNMKIDVLGIAETFWKDSGSFITTLPEQEDKYKVIFSGGKQNRKGVALIFRNKTANTIIYHQAISERIILAKIQAKPRNILVIQVYCPNEDKEENQKEEFYEEINELIKEHKKYNDCLIIMGDFNAKVGEAKEDNTVGPYGLGMRSEGGQTLVDFCKRTNLYITNTWFEQKKRARHTWTAPDKTHKNQIDFILMEKRYRNNVKNSKARPGADCGSDHNPVIMTMTRIKLKQTKKRQPKIGWNIEKLNNKEDKEEYETITNEKLERTKENKDPNILWNKIKECIKEVADNICGKQEQNKRQPWITTEILKKMEERKRLKNNMAEETQQQYLQKKHEIQKMCREAKNNYINDKCKEIEDLDKKHNPLMYTKIKELNPKIKDTNQTIKDKTGRTLSNREEILDRWREYVENLYQDNRSENIAEEQVQEHTVITEEEIKQIIKKLPKKKANGTEGICAELLQHLGTEGTEIITRLINLIYKTGKMPDDFVKCIFIPIPKKNRAQECEEYRTISLIAHASKILLHIIKNRIGPIIEEMLSESQLGFRKGKGTRDAIFQIRTLCEKTIKRGGNVHICFIDYKKAFDKVNHEKLMETLKWAGIPELEQRLIRNLYWNETATIRVNGEESEPIHIKKGVRQGCVLSPMLFNVYTEYLIKEALEQTPGIKINGITYNILRYADDTIIFTENERDLQYIMDKITAKSKEYEMEINRTKTKTMIVSKKRNLKHNIIIDNIKLEQVKEYKYLGSYITEDGRCNRDINARIAMAKEAFWSQKQLLRRDINLKLKLRILRCYVYSTLTYACENWTLTKQMKEKISAFEMWCFRRILKISWQDKIKNEEVLKIIGEKRNLLAEITKRKMQYAGHIMRGSCTEQAKIFLEGKYKGNITRGRPRREWLDEIKEQTKIENYGKLKRYAEDRNLWRQLITVNLQK